MGGPILGEEVKQKKQAADSKWINSRTVGWLRKRHRQTLCPDQPAPQSTWAGPSSSLDATQARNLQPALLHVVQLALVCF